MVEILLDRLVPGSQPQRLFQRALGFPVAAEGVLAAAHEEVVFGRFGIPFEQLGAQRRSLLVLFRFQVCLHQLPGQHLG